MTLIIDNCDLSAYLIIKTSNLNEELNKTSEALK